MIKVIHKAGELNVLVDQIATVMFDDTELAYKKKSKYKYIVTVLLKSGAEIAIHKGNDKEYAAEACRLVRDLIIGMRSPDEPIIYSKEYVVGPVYDC